MTKEETPSKYRPSLPFGYFKTTGMCKYLIKMKLSKVICQNYWE